jgi:hypothetical protein
LWASFYLSFLIVSAFVWKLLTVVRLFNQSITKHCKLLNNAGPYHSVNNSANSSEKRLIQTIFFKHFVKDIEDHDQFLVYSADACLVKRVKFNDSRYQKTFLAVKQQNAQLSFRLLIMADLSNGFA